MMSATQENLDAVEGDCYENTETTNVQIRKATDFAASYNNQLNASLLLQDAQVLGILML